MNESVYVNSLNSQTQLTHFSTLRHAEF